MNAHLAYSSMAEGCNRYAPAVDDLVPEADRTLYFCQSRLKRQPALPVTGSRLTSTQNSAELRSSIPNVSPDSIAETGGFDADMCWHPFVERASANTTFVIPVPGNTRVWLAAGVIHLHKISVIAAGFQYSLAGTGRAGFGRGSRFPVHLFVFRGRRCDLAQNYLVA